jgi:hypothetical protein
MEVKRISCANFKSLGDVELSEEFTLERMKEGVAFVMTIFTLENQKIMSKRGFIKIDLKGD